MRPSVVLGRGPLARITAVARGGGLRRPGRLRRRLRLHRHLRRPAADGADGDDHRLAGHQHQHHIDHLDHRNDDLILLGRLARGGGTVERHLGRLRSLVRRYRGRYQRRRILERRDWLGRHDRRRRGLRGRHDRRRRGLRGRPHRSERRSGADCRRHIRFGRRRDRVRLGVGVRQRRRRHPVVGSGSGSGGPRLVVHRPSRARAQREYYFLLGVVADGAGVGTGLVISVALYSTRVPG